MTSRVGEIYDQVKAQRTLTAEDIFRQSMEHMARHWNDEGAEDPAIVRARDDVTQMILAAFKDHERYQTMSNVYVHKKDKDDEYEVSFRVRVRPYDVIADLKKAVGK